MTVSASKSEVLSWGTGDAIPGTPFREVVTTSQAGGRLVVLAIDMPAGERVDEHVHQREDQITIVVDGTVGALLGDTQYLLEAGSVLFMPRSIPHAQWNPGASSARVLEIYTPGGFEAVFHRAGQLIKSGRSLGPDDFERRRQEWNCPGS